MGENQGQEGEEEQVRMWVLIMLILQQSSLIQKQSTIITHPTHTIHQS